MPFYKGELWYKPKIVFIGPNRNGLIIESNAGRAYKIAKQISDFSSFRHNPIKLGNHDWPHQTYALHHLQDKWICYHERDQYIEEFNLSTDVQKKYRVKVPRDLMIVGYDRMDYEHCNLIAYTKGDTWWRYPFSIVILNIKKHLQKNGIDSQNIITDIETVVTLEDLIPQRDHEEVCNTTIQTSTIHPHLILIQVQLEAKKETYLCDRLQNNSCIKVFDSKVGFLQCLDTLSSCTNYKMKKLPRKLLAIKSIPEFSENCGKSLIPKL